jgi:hypothetical protein
MPEKKWKNTSGRLVANFIKKHLIKTTTSSGTEFATISLENGFR